MKIEIVSWRDDENEEKVFVDGELLTEGVEWTLVDPGRGYDIAEWRENKRYALQGASEAAAKVIAEMYDSGERTSWVTKPRGTVTCDYCGKEIHWSDEIRNFHVVGLPSATECRGEESPDQLHMGG